MGLLIGTLDGLFHVGDGFETVERPLEERVNRLHVFGDEALAATSAGLYHSEGGWEWTKVESFAGPVHSMATTPDGDCWYVGISPAAVYVSEDGGETWTESASFQNLPSRDRWRDRAPGNDATVRTMAVHSGAPDRLAVGVEPGGVFVSVDGGATWNERCAGVHDDVHHLLALGVDEYLAATGNGLYGTDDAGRTWLRQDTDFRDFWFNYFRETVAHDGTLYAAANGWGPASPGGALFEASVDGTGREATRVPYPGEKESFVVSWAVDDDQVYAGTMRIQDGFEQHAPGQVLRREEHGWIQVGEVPAAARSLATI
ncbi:WD40/YVTN/BNR-like repeat-containing protein [Haloarchaeobius amylolyticus]|uniref:WD40/YVTN/BNR-like repeat-containing protein n=1 Tax=Haloarchaeobius amylolyticus TaxID=1198296 RepID=UPI00226EBEEC|nr:glycosyl hydrolase [Haloarchaeobius amylolyticus]